MELKEHQRIGARLLLRDSSQFICDEMGLGKTATVITAIKARKLKPVLIVVPCSLRTNWQQEFEKWAGIRASIDTVNDNYCIINYEKLMKYKWDILDRHFQMIVFDECHLLKTPTSQRTKTAITLSKAIPYKILMSGTPLLNRPVELWSQIEVLGWQQRFGGKNYFYKRYCGATTSRYGVSYQGYSNLKELSNKLHRYIIRRTKTDLLDSLPPKEVIELPVCTIPQPPPTSFQDIQKYDTIALRGKLPLCIDFIKVQLHNNEKLVVFAHHRNIVQKLLQAFPNARCIIGGQSIQERDRNIKEWRTQEDIHLLICSLQASAVGLTLTEACVAIFIEYPWSPALLAQAQDRIHRLSQTKPCTIYYLYAAKSIDEYRLNTNAAKNTIIQYVMK